MTVSKTAAASLTRIYKWNIAKSADKTSVKIADGSSATFNYTVSVAHDSGTDSAWKVTGNITVNNPNAFSVSGVSVSDSIDPNATCVVSGGSTTIAANSSAVYNYTCTYSQAPAAASQTNTATATWTAFGSPSTTASGTASVTWANATVTVKDGSVSVTDTLGGNLGTVLYTDPSPKSFTYSKTFPGVAGTCKTYDNTATFTTNDTGTTGSASKTVTVCVGKDLTVTKTATASLNRTYKWLIDKSVDKTQINIAEGGTATFNYTVAVTPNGYTDDGYTLGGTITVNNPNDWEAITLTSVTDTLDQNGTCDITESAPYTVPKSGSLVLHYTCTTGGTSTKNTATVTWDKTIYSTPTGTASGDATVTFTTANETNKTITVVDDKTTGTPVTLGTSDYFAGPFEFKYSISKQGVAGECTDYTNTATISQTSQSDSQKVTVCVGKDLTVTKTATASLSRTYKWLIDKSVDDTRIEIAEGGTATFNYTVKVTPDGYTDSGYTLGGTITVNNPNTWEDVTVNVADTLDQGGTCAITESAPYVVPKNGSLVLHYTCATDGTSTKNTATATWNKATYVTPTGSASGDATVSFTTATETNKTITVVDDKTTGTPVTLGTSDYFAGPFEFTYALEKQGVAGTCTNYTNTAKISETGQTDSQKVTVCVGKDLTVSKTAESSFTRTYKWSIEKLVDDTQFEIADGDTATFNYTVKVSHDAGTDSALTVVGKITVTNPNDWEDIVVDVTDALDTGACSVTGGTGVAIPAGKSVVLDYTCASADPATTKNTATATWDKATYFTPNGSASGSANVAFGAPTTIVDGSVTVVDDKTDPKNPVSLGSVSYTDPSPKTFTYSVSKKGVAGTCTDYTNTATFTTNTTGTEDSDSVTVTVCVGADLTVSKTAAGTFNRAYLWSIQKSADKTEVKIAEGGDYTFKYTVDVAQTDIIDSGYTLSGKITITNPNDWQAITLTGLTDVIDNGGTCTVAAGPYIVPKSGSIEVAYTCSYGSAPSSYSGKNTATASWDKAAAFTPTGAASGNANFTLTQAGSTNKTIHVTDSYAGALGTVTATDTTPFATKSFTYDRTEKGVAGTCTTYDNTATITETGQSSSQSVELCVAKDLTVSKTAAGTFNRLYTWSIKKSADKTEVSIAEGGDYTFKYTVDVEQTGVTDSGWTLSGKITVTNPNNWQDITADVTDLVNNGGTCSVTGGTGVVVGAGKSVELDYTCSYGSAPSSYSGTNIATASWDKAAAFTPSGTASGSADFTLTQLGSINKTIEVVDTYAGTLGTVTATDTTPFTTKSFTYDRTEKGVAGTCTTYDNTATIVETQQSASEQVKLCVAKDLTVSKTAAGTFDRLYTWSIKKSADKTEVKIAEGDNYTFKYTVDVKQTGVTDSGYTLSGKITITNPNDWQPITLTVLTDVIDNGGTCTVAAGPYIVPKSGSIEVAYTCSYGSAPSSYSGTNTATATWDKAAAFTPTGSASGNAPFTLAQLGSTNKTIEVVDTYKGTLGTVTATDTTPFTTKSFTYDRTEKGVAGTCTKYDNTATIVETQQSASEQVKLCVAKDLTVSKTAAGTFDRAYNWSIDKSADKTSVSIADGTDYTFKYTVEVKQTGVTDSGWTLSGKITVSNPNDWQDITADVTDLVNNGGTCSVAGGTGVVVGAGKSVELDYTCSYGSAPSSYSGTNIATASWDKAAAFTPSGTASGSADFTLTQLGSTNKTIEVVDTYAGTLGTVTATDTTPFTTKSFTYDRTEKGVAGTCTNYDNTATIVETNQSDSQTVELCVAKDLTVSKTAAGTFNRAYLWSIKKSADKTSVSIADGTNYTFHYAVDVAQTGITDSGWTLSGKITITNPNDWQPITLTVLTDVIDNGGTCTVAAGPYIVPKSGTIEVAYTCSYSSAPSSYSGKNTATATWDKAAAFTPTGSASGNANFTLTQLGSTNKTINVTDSYAGALGTVTATDTTPFTTKSFTYDRTEKGVAGTCTNYDNTATITETKQSSSQTVKLCVAKDLTVSKTAIPAFARTYLWNISKAVDKTTITQVSGSAVFNYTVVVNQTGFTDSGWKVMGKITVTNPNDWESIVANVTDALDTGACSVVGGSNVTIPAGKSVVLDYTCDPASSAATKNTATATWDKAAAFTPSGTASGNASVAFVTPTSTTNKTITVTDTFNGTTTTLGSVTATDSMPYTSKTFTYSRSIAVTFGCKSYNNTAKIVETGQTASQTVTVCGPTQTGALTIGFWQNKNGQGIITGQAKSGVCPSVSWLRQYAPFQDLSATATCAQVGTYVTNIIKAANASGAAMNAMLKAQMLATALDVYFSDPALGGNKIGAPKPIGSVTIDLTKICKITDSSGGATCGGTTANAGTAFGGATSLTVLQILAYAASQSNAGGSTWYAQNKSIQELAKNTFDAINNEWAFAP